MNNSCFWQTLNHLIDKRDLVRKLPVLPAFAHALKSTWHNLPFAFYVSWPWLLVLVPLNIWADSGMVDFDPLNITAEQLPMVQASLLRMYVSMFISMIIYSSIGIMWHRYILKDEVPSGAQRVRLDRSVARYVGNTIIIALCVSLAVVPFALIMSIFIAASPAAGGLLFAASMAMIVAVIMPVTYRLSIKLPAIALGRKDFRLPDAWKATQGNMTPLMALGTLSIAMVLLAGTLVGAAEQGFLAMMSPSLAWVFMVVRQLVAWAMAIFAITLLTSLYGFFVENRNF
jgi:hypothetical protein